MASLVVNSTLRGALPIPALKRRGLSSKQATAAPALERQSLSCGLSGRGFTRELKRRHAVWRPLLVARSSADVSFTGEKGLAFDRQWEPLVLLDSPDAASEAVADTAAEPVSDKATDSLVASSAGIQGFAPPESATTATPERAAGSKEERDDRSSAKSSGEVPQATGPQEAESGKQFLWEKHWYPVALIEDLDPAKPTPFTLLGQDMVLWRDNQGLWRAHKDLCPHRLAPLSEGRIDEKTGDLQCSYHGWTFRGDGTCSGIPQADTTGPEARAASSNRACVSVYPTQVSQGLLFVWPEAGRWTEALTQEPLKLPPEFEDTKNFSTVSIQRDLFYGYDVLMENVCDPSHIEFAHHKVTGRRDRARPLPFTVSEVHPRGFSGVSEGNPRITTEFLPPCGVFSKLEIHIPLPFVGTKVAELWICSLNIPMGPGRTRSIVCSARNFARITVPGKEWWAVYPRWLEHLTSNKVYDGDMVVLQGQEKALHGQGRSESYNQSESEEGEPSGVASGSGSGSGNGAKPRSYGSMTFTPTAADRVVLAFRNWLRRYGGGTPKWSAENGAALHGPLPSTVMSKREMLDRMSQHTEVCSSCKAAYKGINAWGVALLSLGALLLAAATVPPVLAVRAALALSAVASLALGAWLRLSLAPQFVFVDYVHAHID